jgi:hypothetical protein
MACSSKTLVYSHKITQVNKQEDEVPFLWKGPKFKLIKLITI